jgi:hypothetical protein
MLKSNGNFYLSFDFEKFWGVSDLGVDSPYINSNIKNVDSVFPSILEFLDEYGVAATFATVGLLFSNRNDISEFKNYNIPYINTQLNPFINLDKILKLEDRIIFGGNALDMLLKNKKHEIASHTFSHFYCLEKNVTISDFENDLINFKNITNQYDTKTLIFPRNQYNPKFIPVLKKYGYKFLRVNNESSFIYKTRVNSPFYIRLLRLIDRYFPISKISVSKIIEKDEVFLQNDSRFFAPYIRKLSFLEPFKVNRIKNEMTFCAKNNLDYHLWTHPHNFGANSLQMLDQFKLILKHYKFLHDLYGFNSKKMNQISTS